MYSPWILPRVRSHSLRLLRVYWKVYWRLSRKLLDNNIAWSKLQRRSIKRTIFKAILAKRDLLWCPWDQPLAVTDGKQWQKIKNELLYAQTIHLNTRFKYRPNDTYIKILVLMERRKCTWNILWENCLKTEMRIAYTQTIEEKRIIKTSRRKFLLVKIGIWVI